jgi:hypothetical protein
MRKVVQEDTGVLTVLLGALCIMLLIFLMPSRTRQWIYPLVRQATQMKVNYGTRYMKEYETAHYIVKYTPVDADTVDMVAEAAEAAYQPVVEKLGYTPHGKTLILIYPSKAELRQAFGWSDNESAMGVYWGGVIQVLSPHVWLNGGESVQEFIHSGPMVHEYTHLVFDYITNGNYPRWFTEGLAQFVEYRVNNYEWKTAGNKLDNKMYTMAQLDQQFDELPNQALAYRESLAAVRYIDEVYGEDKLRGIISSLKANQTLENAIAKTLGIDYATFELSWKQWAVAHMNGAIEK